MADKRILKLGTGSDISGYLPDEVKVRSVSNVDTGTLSIANGGTGLATTPTNGQLLIGSGSSYALANLTAGSNITITNGSGSITIASTGGSSATASFLSTSYTGSDGYDSNSYLIRTNYQNGGIYTTIIGESGSVSNKTGSFLRVVGGKGYAMTASGDSAGVGGNLQIRGGKGGGVSIGTSTATGSTLTSASAGSGSSLYINAGDGGDLEGEALYNYFSMNAPVTFLTGAANQNPTRPVKIIKINNLGRFAAFFKTSTSSIEAHMYNYDYTLGTFSRVATASIAINDNNTTYVQTETIGPWSLDFVGLANHSSAGVSVFILPKTMTSTTLSLQAVTFTSSSSAWATGTEIPVTGVTTVGSAHIHSIVGMAISGSTVNKFILNVNADSLMKSIVCTYVNTASITFNTGGMATASLTTFNGGGRSFSYRQGSSSGSGYQTNFMFYEDSTANRVLMIPTYISGTTNTASYGTKITASHTTSLGISSNTALAIATDDRDYDHNDYISVTSAGTYKLAMLYGTGSNTYIMPMTISGSSTTASLATGTVFEITGNFPNGVGSSYKYITTVYDTPSMDQDRYGHMYAAIGDTSLKKEMILRITGSFSTASIKIVNSTTNLSGGLALTYADSIAYAKTSGTFNMAIVAATTGTTHQVVTASALFNNNKAGNGKDLYLYAGSPGVNLINQQSGSFGNVYISGVNVQVTGILNFQSLTDGYSLSIANSTISAPSGSLYINSTSSIYISAGSGSAVELGSIAGATRINGPLVYNPGSQVIVTGNDYITAGQALVYVSADTGSRSLSYIYDGVVGSGSEAYIYDGQTITIHNDGGYGNFSYTINELGNIRTTGTTLTMATASTVQFMWAAARAKWIQISQPATISQP